MKPFDALRLATHAIKSRALESLLIVFAVALGAGVVTVMVALILNASELEQKLHNNLEARELRVMVRDQNDQGYYESGSFSPIVGVGKATRQTVQLQEAELAGVQLACPAVQFAYVTQFVGITEIGGVGNPFEQNNITFLGVSKDFFKAAGLRLLAGTWPTDKDFRDHNRLLLLNDWYSHQRLSNKNNQRTQQELKNIIGQKIQGFTIIGVFEAPPEMRTFSSEQYPSGVQGITTFGVRASENVGASDLTELRFLAKNNQDDSARDQLMTYVSRRWGDSVAVYNNRARIDAELNSTRNATTVTALLAMCGLAVAALNITNLMLARVLSRKRSIGISSALGASRVAIFGLFLLESLVLGLLGGLLGMVFARCLTYGLEINAMVSNQFTNQANMRISPQHFLLGFLTATALSLVFGTYPAWAATQIRPSEALRD